MSTISDLAAYIVLRKNLAEDKDIATTAGDKESASHALVSNGMAMAFREILDWLEARGVSSNVKK